MPEHHKFASESLWAALRELSEENGMHVCAIKVKLDIDKRNL